MSERIAWAVANASVSPTVFLHAGEPWAADDPVVKANPGMFTLDGSRFIHRTVPAEQVEQATRAPGEKRATRRA